MQVVVDVLSIHSQSERERMRKTERERILPKYRFQLDSLPDTGQ